MYFYLFYPLAIIAPRWDNPVSFLGWASNTSRFNPTLPQPSQEKETSPSQDHVAVYTGRFEFSVASLSCFADVVSPGSALLAGDDVV